MSHGWDRSLHPLQLLQRWHASLRIIYSLTYQFAREVDGGASEATLGTASDLSTGRICHRFRWQSSSESVQQRTVVDHGGLLAYPCLGRNSPPSNSTLMNTVEFSFLVKHSALSSTSVPSAISLALWVSNRALLCAWANHSTTCKRSWTWTSRSRVTSDFTMACASDTEHN